MIHCTIGNRSKTKRSTPIMDKRLAMWHNANLKTLRVGSLPGLKIRNILVSHRHDLIGDTFNFGYIIQSNIHWPVAMNCSRYRWVDSFVMHEWTDAPWTTGLDNQILVIALRTCTMKIPLGLLQWKIYHQIKFRKIPFVHNISFIYSVKFEKAHIARHKTAALDLNLRNSCCPFH